MEESQISRATEPWHVLAIKHLGTTLLIFLRMIQVLNKISSVNAIHLNLVILGYHCNLKLFVNK